MSLPIAAMASRKLSIETPMAVPWKFPPWTALSPAASMSGLSLTELISLWIACVAYRIAST